MPTNPLEIFVQECIVRLGILPIVVRIEDAEISVRARNLVHREGLDTASSSRCSSEADGIEVGSERITVICIKRISSSATVVDEAAARRIAEALGKIRSS